MSGSKRKLLQIQLVLSTGKAAYVSRSDAGNLIVDPAGASPLSELELWEAREMFEKLEYVVNPNHGS